MWKARHLLVLWIVAACGDDGGTPDARNADARIADASVVDAAIADAAVDAATSDASPPDGSPPDAATADATPPDAASPDAPVITAVVTIDGFTQIRQGETVEVLITGERLAATTSVMLGGLPVEILAATAQQLRVQVSVPNGHPPGPVVLVVTTPAGVATRQAAITTTYIVVAVDGTLIGHGTYPSPLAFCPEFGGHYVPGGSTLELLAGAFVCDRGPSLDLGVGSRVLGSGRGVTIVRDSPGFMVESSSITGTTTLTDFTASSMVGPLLDPGSGSGSLRLDVRRVALERATGPVVTVGPTMRNAGLFVTLDDVQFDGTGTAVDIQSHATVTITNTQIRNCTTGVEHQYGDLTITGSTIAGCETGVIAGPLGRSFGSGSPVVDIIDSRLVDDRTGVVQRSGTVRLMHSEVVDDPATPAVCQTGILTGYALLYVVGQSTIRATQFGVVGRSDCNFGEARVVVGGSDIRGGEVGVLTLFCGTGVLRLRGARVHGGSGSGVFASHESAIYDLGTADDPGQNALSTDTGFALNDNRMHFVAPPRSPTIDGGTAIREINAVGTTLNGRSYAGQTIEGPAEQPPDYRIAANGLLVF
jgi:hypothetical protein